MSGHRTRIENVRIFDGFRMSEATEVVFEGDRIVEGASADRVIDGGGKFLLPGLIDTHTHITKPRNAALSIRLGVTSTFAIGATEKVMRLGVVPRIYSTHYRAVGSVEDGEAYVTEEVAHGAKYVKIVVEDPPHMAKKTIRPDVMKDIVAAAHRQGLKVAVHAVSVPTLQMAIDAGTDIYIHVPLEAEIPPEMVSQIAASGAPVVPTLVMMKGFADSPIFGYKKDDYRYAQRNMMLLHDAGVPVLAGSDANNVIILPRVRFGIDLQTELRLLVEAGLTTTEALTGATGLGAKAFGFEDVGAIEPGRYADFLLVDGDPVKNMDDIGNIRQVWMGGKPVYEA